MKKRVGRPKKLKRESRAPGISVRLSPDELLRINSAIRMSGKTRSDWIRDALLSSVSTFGI